jgi:hypothetical protein
MANILIDGYNLIGVAHRDFEKARNDLLQRINRYADLTGHSVTVVFDGWKNGQAAETKTRIGGVTVIYSSLGEKADDVIKRMLSSSAKQWIAVSSDREIYKFAEKKDCVALLRDEFEARLDASLDAGSRNSMETFSEDDDDFDLTRTGKKGNPRKLSKKNKKKIETMKKL